MNTPLKIIIVLLLLCAISVRVYLHFEPVPEAIQALYKTKRITDNAALFTEEQKTRIEEYHAALLKDHDIDYHVATLTGKHDIAMTAVKLFKENKVGKLSKTGRGLLLLIDPEQNTVRLEVSTSLEAVFTDAFVSYIQNRQMVAFFASERITDGILASTEMIFIRAQKAEAGQEFVPPMKSVSVGGGADVDAHIGQGQKSIPKYQSTKTTFQDATNTPLHTVSLYYQAMKNRDARPDLPIYSKATKEFLSNWTVTAAQMDNVYRETRQCGPAHVVTMGKIAVVRYPVKQRTCAPYFLHTENGKWVLDLSSMSKAIRFNHRNQWHFVTSVKHPYWFGFTDWRADKNGFFHERPAQKLRWGYTVRTNQFGNTYVVWVQDGSAAERLGLRVGDETLMVGNQKVVSHKSFLHDLRKYNEGETARVLIKRAGHQMWLEGKAPARISN